MTLPAADETAAADGHGTPPGPPGPAGGAVVIAGGGPVGLTLAIELGQQGVPCELVDKRLRPGRLPKMERCNHLPGIELGYRYTGSALIVPERGDGPDPDSFEFTPTTWPGTRLPHLWLDDGTPVQDHLGRCYTLLHAPGADAGLAGLGRAFARFGAPFTTFEVCSRAAGAVYEGYRLILVRPDLHVAWRGHGPPPDPGWLAAMVTGHGQPHARPPGVPPG